MIARVTILVAVVVALPLAACGLVSQMGWSA